MSVQKKSLISNRAVVKKAMIASQPAEGNETIGEAKSLQAMSLKMRNLKGANFRTLKKKQ
jgi:hypothetical protein